MPRRNAHMLIGAASAVLADLGLQYLRADGDPGWKVDFGELLLAGVVGAAAGVIPDLLEPATTPNHRGVFHSLVAGVVVLWVSKKAYSLKLTPEVRALLLPVACAYVSHLAADAMTPRSIRLI